MVVAQALALASKAPKHGGATNSEWILTVTATLFVVVLIAAFRSK